MAGRKKKGKSGSPRRRRSRAFGFVLALLIAAGVFFGRMSFCAHACRLCLADVYLADLPQALNGTTLLFLSDINLKSERDAKHAARLLNRLDELHPDILLLGGDYCTQGTLELLNSAEAETDGCMRRFCEGLASFSAPMGKYAVCGEKDGEEAARMLTAAGVTCLNDSAARIEREGAGFTIAGLGDYTLRNTPFTKLAAAFSRDDCVIAVSHDPAAYAEIRTAEASDGGAWADLVLSGHTLGGQISLFGRTLRGEKTEDYGNGGWQHTNDVPLLISQGLGCEGAQLRLGSRCEVWLITLKKGRSR